jgi:hypothetical protein
MIEELKELEQKAMDELNPEVYEDISSSKFSNEEWELYLAGYIDGLQKAILLASENNSTMSYTMDIDEMFGEDYARIDEDENTN